MYLLKAQVKGKGNIRRTPSVTNKTKLITLKLAFWKPKTLDVKLILFDCHVAVCVKKRHTNAVFGCSQFQKFNLDCLLH